MHLTRLTASFLALSAAAAPIAWGAEAECAAASPECAVVGKVEIGVSLGFGQRSNPVAGRSDIPLVVLPRISYYGKRFFLENLELGFTLHEGTANAFNVIATPGYDRVFFYRHDLQNIFVQGRTLGGAGGFAASPVTDASGRVYEVGPRHTTFLVGPEWTFQYGRVTGQLNALREVTAEHEGHEVRAALAAPLVQAKGSLVASAGFTWKSTELVRYYYGIDELYEPGSAFNPFVKLRYGRPLTERTSVYALAHYERLAGAIGRSPLITERHVTTFFAGVAFRVY